MKLKLSELRDIILEEITEDDYLDYSKDMERNTRCEKVEPSENIPDSEDEITPDRKTAVLMQKFGNDPLYKAVIDANDKDAVVKALNKLTKEKGLYAATYFLNYYKRLGMGGNTAATVEVSK